MKIRWFCTVIWRYNDFQNGGRPPSWNRFTSTTIWDHPRSLCCWPQLPVKFHVNVIHSSEDIVIWIFRIFGLKCLFRPQNGSFGGFWTLKCDYLSSSPQKGTSLPKSASFKLSTVKIRWGVWPVCELTESVTDTQTDRQTHTGKFILCPCIALDRQWVSVCTAANRSRRKGCRVKLFGIDTTQYVTLDMLLCYVIDSGLSTSLLLLATLIIMFYITLQHMLMGRLYMVRARLVC